MMKTTVSFDKLTGTSLGSYRLERFIGKSKIGPTFLARVDSTTTYLVRFLDGPLYATPGERQAYLERFQHRTRQIAALQHPHILPLLDYDVYRGYPYLISPHIPLRSLRTRIEKNGALPTFTVGRYLDQITTALEYTYEHAVLHGSLSVDSIFIRLDGNLVVADVGVMSLLDQGIPGNQLHEWNDGYAPEQLLGRPASPASDVYALGMVIYHLLIGSPVFDGNTPDDFAQQHLYTAIPPLNQQRSDLPPSLYSVLARALAKDPAQRFSQPGAFANAYHRSVMPANRMRVPFVVSEVPNTPVNHGPITNVPVMDVPLYERPWNHNGSNASATIDHMEVTPRPPLLTPNPPSLHGFPEDEPLNLIDTPRSMLARHDGRIRLQPRTLILLGVLAALLVITSIVGIALSRRGGAAVSNATGQVTFFANQDNPGGQTNSLRIVVQNLATLSAGYNYDAWIINDQAEQFTALGSLTQSGQTWTLIYNGGSNNLLAVGDKMEVTQEQGAVNAPAGQVVLTGTFPVQAFQHIQHLLVSFPENPGQVGFLVGLLSQVRLLDNQAVLLQSFASGKDTSAMICTVQSMLDIIEGAHGAHYLPLAAGCKQQGVTTNGDGLGLLGKSGFVGGAEEHAALALSQKDATNVMRQHAALMDIALNNISGWVTTIDQDLLPLRANPNNLSPVQQIATLADDAYHGVDINGDGQIAPVPGEAGAITAYQQGQLMASLSLTSGS